MRRILCGLGALSLVGASKPAPPPASSPKAAGGGLLSCRAPWACELSEDLRGATLAALGDRLGEPYWTGDGEAVYAIGGSCFGDSQYVHVRHEVGVVTEAGFEWSLSPTGCVQEAEAYRPGEAPLDGIPCPFAASECPAMKAVEGLSASRVVEALGVPDFVEGATWTYWSPRGCSDERDVITIEMRGDTAVVARWVHEHTGEICEFAE